MSFICRAHFFRCLLNTVLFVVRKHRERCLMPSIKISHENKATVKMTWINKINLYNVDAFVGDANSQWRINETIVRISHAHTSHFVSLEKYLNNRLSRASQAINQTTLSTRSLRTVLHSCDIWNSFGWSAQRRWDLWRKIRGNEKTTTKQMRELKTFAMQCKSQPQKKCHKLKFCAIYDWFMWFVNRSTKHIQWYIVRDGLSEFIIITQTFSIQIRMPGICLRCVAERAHTRACAQMNFVVTISVEHRCVYQLANCAAGTKAMAMTYTLLASCARVQ